MAARVRVSCINKREHFNPHERIINIGGVNPDNSRWKLSQANAIKSIEDGKFSFYTHVAGYTADVIIALHNGNKYLKTKEDATHKDNLLSLPECSP